jgi:hypothetical protein
MFGDSLNILSSRLRFCDAVEVVPQRCRGARMAESGTRFLDCLCAVCAHRAQVFLGLQAGFLWGFDPFHAAACMQSEFAN